MNSKAKSLLIETLKKSTKKSQWMDASSALFFDNKITSVFDDVDFGTYPSRLVVDIDTCAEIVVVSGDEDIVVRFEDVFGDKAETPEEKEAFDSMASNSEFPNSSDWGGEGLPPVGAECEFSCEGFWGDNDYHWCRFLGLLSDDSYAIEFHHPTSPSRVTCGCFDPQCTLFRKPETPQQREERERLEAAYDLYLTRLSSSDDFVPYTYDEFLCENDTKFGFLAIVDKTGYRKAK